MDVACRICGSGDKVHFVVREMMFGTRESFDYFECTSCGCLQIARIPEDLSRYYPPGYYAHSLAARTPKQTFRRRMQRHAAVGLLDRRSSIRSWLGFVWAPPPFVEWACRAGIGFDAAVLDVGSGTGRLLHEMAEFGFTDVTGIDPHIEGDVASSDGVRCYKRDLASEPGRYDFVIVNHTLEHLPDPHATLANVRRTLQPGGCALVRLPVKDSLAWEEYGVDWVQLDAPRHLFLFTEASLRQLAEKAGFRVEQVTRDSTAFQFWGSELYRRGIPLNPPDRKESPRHHFGRKELRSFRRRAKRLNREGRGDAACFYLRGP